MAPNKFLKTKFKKLGAAGALVWMINAQKCHYFWNTRSGCKLAHVHHTGNWMCARSCTAANLHIWQTLGSICYAHLWPLTSNGQIITWLSFTEAHVFVITISFKREILPVLHTNRKTCCLELRCIVGNVGLGFKDLSQSPERNWLQHICTYLELKYNITLSGRVTTSDLKKF